MPATKASWASLPPSVRDAIESHTGTVYSTSEVTTDFNSDLAVIVHAKTGRYFVKGLRSTRAQAWTHRVECAINPHIAHISAPVRWSTTVGEWMLLGFDYIAGRSANYRPQSPDFPHIVEALKGLGNISCPVSVEKTAEHRWRNYSRTPDLFAGTSLLHTDWKPDNLIITAQRAVLVDWAWATRGAAWIDAACWVTWLIASGHNPRNAENHVTRLPSWKRASAQALYAFADAQTAMWEDISAERKGSWEESMFSAARRWRDYRRRVSSGNA